MLKQKWFLLGSCMMCLGLVTGCSQDHEGNLSLKRLEVHKEIHSEEFTSHDLSQEKLNVIASDYQRNGNDGPVTLMVQYDPSSSKNTAMNATRHASLIAEGLREAGVQNIKTEIMPVNEVGHHSKTLIQYDRFSAHAPDGCDNLMPGLNNTKTDWKANEEYQYGCTVETIIAKQVVNPTDLMGREGFDSPADGRRATNITELYRLGEPNPPLEGQTATEE